MLKQEMLKQVQHDTSPHTVIPNLFRDLIHFPSSHTLSVILSRNRHPEPIIVIPTHAVVPNLFRNLKETLKQVDAETSSA